MTDTFPLTRRGALGVAALAAAPALPAWANAPQPLRIVGPWEIGGLAPARSGHLFTRLQVVETLMEADDDGTPRPGLAAQWEVSDDGLAWRFTLRPTARFHDGSPVEAAAVVRCLEAARVPPSLLSAAPIAAVDAPDRQTVRIRLTRPHRGLGALLAHSSTMVLAPASYGPGGAVRAIVGSGPYRVTRLVPPQHIEVERFPGHDGPMPVVDRVRYLAAGRAETRALMAEGGYADLAYGLDPVSLTRLRQRPPVRIAAVTLPRTTILKVNAGLPMLRDPRVRQALSLSIDRAGIARALLRDPDLAATQLFPPTLAGWHDTSLPPLTRDPEAARQLFEAAGWRRAPDGLRDPQGRPAELLLRTFPDRPELPMIATALQAQWREAGLAVRVSIGNSGDVPLGHRDGSLQLALVARNFATVPDPTGTLLQDFGPAGGDWGAMGWSSPAVVRALDTLSRGQPDATDTARLRGDITRVLQAELPVIPITWYRQQVAVSPRVSGLSLDPLERSYRLTRLAWTS